MCLPSPPYDQELRWRGEAAARALVKVAASAAAADATAAAGLKRLEENVAKVDAHAAKAAAESARLGVQLIDASRSIDDVQSRVAAAAVAAGEHEHAEAVRFQGLSSSLDDAKRGGVSGVGPRLRRTSQTYICCEKKTFCVFYYIK